MVRFPGMLIQVLSTSTDTDFVRLIMTLTRNRTRLSPLKNWNITIGITWTTMYVLEGTLLILFWLML